MPKQDYTNVACVRPEDDPTKENCDEEDIHAPKLWIKKTFTDGSKTKVVSI
jgi:hypothetical protein